MQIGLDNVLAAWAVIQTVITTLRAGSRAVYLLRHGEIGVMDGPVIHETSPLYEATQLFRECVRLGLHQQIQQQIHLGNFTSSVVEYHVHNVPVTSSSTTTYSLSPFGNRNARHSDDVMSAEESMRLDQEIERILNETDVDAYHQRLQTRILQGLSTTFSVPASRTALFAASLPRTAANSIWNLRRYWRGEYRGRRDDVADDVVEEMLLYDEDEAARSDFSVSLQTSVSIDSASSNDSTEPSLRKARITAIAPKCFADLRRSFGISESAYVKSLLNTGPYVSFQSNSKGAARAGLWFFFTRDGAFMIKTIKHDEVEALRSMLPKYHRFMQRHGQRSLLTKFCGMYQVTTMNDEEQPDAKPVTFVVMNSVFPAEAHKLLTERFDIKGSTLGRECSVEERETRGTSAVLKDLDLQREVSLVKALPPPTRRGRRLWLGPVMTSEPTQGIHIGATAKAALLKQLRKDVQLLVACDAIDYSLLIGVAKEEFGLDAAMMQVVDTSQQWEIQLQGMRRRSKWKQLSAAALLPLQALLAPPFYLISQSLRIAKKVLIWPDPYYGSGVCLVDAGPLSVIRGSRRNAPATYYFGLIDFLQPYNQKKALEYRIKGLFYPRDSFSCVPPQVYADRFLEFLNEHIT
ncbi:hypothetical protein MPSEU_000298500 [Mayamaea pseudoterrestris]|nr:hypothetical protein MPSEU_000298500 [Mayamaea pseudoterrestris]